MKDLPPVKTKKVRSPNKDSLLFAGLFERVQYEGVDQCGMNDKALLMIVMALSEYPEHRPYDNDWPEHEKEEITFSKWALNELLDEVWDHPWTLASETIFNFILKCHLYAASSVTDGQRRIFEIAAKTASEILEEIEEVEK